MVHIGLPQMYSHQYSSSLFCFIYIYIYKLTYDFYFKSVSTQRVESARQKKTLLLRHNNFLTTDWMKEHMQLHTFTCIGKILCYIKAHKICQTLNGTTWYGRTHFHPAKQWQITIICDSDLFVRFVTQQMPNLADCFLCQGPTLSICENSSVTYSIFWLSERTANKWKHRHKDTIFLKEVKPQMA